MFLSSISNFPPTYLYHSLTNFIHWPFSKLFRFLRTILETPRHFTGRPWASSDNLRLCGVRYDFYFPYLLVAVIRCADFCAKFKDTRCNTRKVYQFFVGYNIYSFNRVDGDINPPKYPSSYDTRSLIRLFASRMQRCVGHRKEKYTCVVLTPAFVFHVYNNW